jgi:hypothetical protein
MTQVDRASERPLLAEEINIVRALLVAAGSRGEKHLHNLDSRLVIDLNDGGMRSIRFVGSNGPLISSLKSAKYLDVDGVLVLIDLYLDDADELHEVDIWKVDFSPLQHYPSPTSLKFDE